MHRRPLSARRLPTGLLFYLLSCTGCNPLQLPDLTGLSSAVPGDSASSTITEDLLDNSLFAQAQPVAVPADGTITIDGTIDSKEDVDIYGLGPAKAGDKIIIDVAGADGLNTAAALFDGNHDLIDANDDRSYYAGQLDPYIRQIIRTDTDNLYVGIAVTRARYFSSTAGRYDSGSYTVKVTRQPGQPFTAPRQQIVYLDFRGGATVQIAAQPAEDMRPFSAESISSRLAGQTDYLIDRVAALMRADYSPYQVAIYDSKSGPPPDEPHSTLYFGNYNKAFLGLSDNIDTGNVSLVQESIIYTEDLSMFEGLQGSADEIAQAIANTGAHELGHLLGLEHASDPMDVMATAATARQIMENDCGFRRSGLDTGVFPAGMQNSPALLLLNVGPNPTASSRLIGVDAPVRPKSDTTWRAAFDFAIPICSRSH